MSAELASPPESDNWDFWYDITSAQFPFLGKTAGDVLRAFLAHEPLS